MTPADFEFLINLIDQKNSNIRERLAVALWFMATGDSCFSL
jgi:hypothetical protein